jgi:sugar/nucleoside kinase (ribokinase family)
LTHRAYDDEAGILHDLRALCPGIIIVTNGARGSLFTDRKKHFRVSILPVKAMDTTGAGDAFGSGFLAGYLRYRGNLLKAITLASENAASDVTKIGAKHGLLSKNQRFNSICISVRPLR